MRRSEEGGTVDCCQKCCLLVCLTVRRFLNPMLSGLGGYVHSGAIRCLAFRFAMDHGYVFQPR